MIIWEVGREIYHQLMGLGGLGSGCGNCFDGEPMGTSLFRFRKSVSVGFASSRVLRRRGGCVRFGGQKAGILMVCGLIAFLCVEC